MPSNRSDVAAVARRHVFPVSEWQQLAGRAIGSDGGCLRFQRDKVHQAPSLPAPRFANAVVPRGTRGPKKPPPLNGCYPHFVRHCGRKRNRA
jgi:hypothetical protein